MIHTSNPSTYQATSYASIRKEVRNDKENNHPLTIFPHFRTILIPKTNVIVNLDTFLVGIAGNYARNY